MLSGRRLLLVWNPSSGRGTSDELAASVEAAALAHGAAKVTLRRTGTRDDAIRSSAAAAEEGFDALLAAGGDGTVTAVATGVLRSGRRLPIGILPLGTGNGLARVLRLPTDPLDAVAALQAGRPVDLDAVEVTSHGRWALLFLGAGLDAEINRDASAASKRRFGFFAYVTATGRNLLRRRNHDVTLTLDGRSERIAAHTVSVFNAGQLPLAGAEIGPPVDPHDGRLDVAVFRSPGAWAAAAQVLRLLSGRPNRTELIEARRVRIDASPPLLVRIDGDVMGEMPLEAVVRPAALRFIADASYDG